MTNIYSYILLIASVLLAGGMVILMQPKLKNNFKLILAFSGSFLLAIAVMHIIPQVYHSSAPNIGVFVLIGFFLQLVLEYFSKGIEHGHIHLHKTNKVIFPLGIFISICIHSFMEGIPLNSTIEHNHKSPLLLGIILHKFPVSIALMTLFLKANIKKANAFFWLLIFSLMAPLGLLVGNNLGSTITQDFPHFFNQVLAIVVGMFLHISTTILFESSEEHKFNLLKLVAFFIGVGVAFAILL